MKVELLTEVTKNSGKVWPTGTIVEVSRDYGLQLIADGLAIEAGATKPAKGEAAKDEEETKPPKAKKAKGWANYQ